MPSDCLQGLSILVVEDMPSIRSLVCRLLNTCGCENVSMAADIASAWEALNADVYDIVLLDHDLRCRRTGIDLIHMVRASDACINQDVPIILLTASNEMLIVTDAVRAGCDGYLVKPVPPDVMAERIIAVLDTRAHAGKNVGDVVWLDSQRPAQGF